MKNTTAIIISFLRPGYTKACVVSLNKMYPEISILVGENADHNKEIAEVCEQNGARYIQLPYDAGICVGRNMLMKHVETEFVLVGDDDFFYDARARTNEMEAFLGDHPEYDLIGGRVIQDGIVRNYQCTVDRRVKVIQLTAIDPDKAEYQTHKGLRYCPADLTFNYFVARTEKVRATPWNEEIKVAYEHLSWFMDFKEAGGKVAFSPDPIVVHKPTHVDPKQANEYGAFRSRREDKERFFNKYKHDYTIGMNGVRDYAPNGTHEIRKNDMKFVDVCITTFKRPKSLERLLFSIAEYYPMANIYVADQDKVLDRAFYKDLRDRLYDAGLAKRLSVESLPYDCGVSYARNHLVTSTPNKFKLILDDDMEFTKETDIGKFIKVMEADNRAGIVGGLMRQNGVDVHFEFTPEKRGNTIFHMENKTNWKSHLGVRYKKSGCVLNFALMKKEIFELIQWDQALKVTEHTDFYLRFQSLAYNVLYTPDVCINHASAERDPEYKQLRTRDEFQKLMFRKHGVTRMKYQNGQVVELKPDGSLERYKELPSERKTP